MGNILFPSYVLFIPDLWGIMAPTCFFPIIMISILPDFCYRSYFLGPLTISALGCLQLFHLILKYGALSSKQHTT